MPSARDRSFENFEPGRAGNRPAFWMPPLAEFCGPSIERVRNFVHERYDHGQLVEVRRFQEIRYSRRRATPRRRPSWIKKGLTVLAAAAAWLFSSYTEAKEVLGDLLKILPAIDLLWEIVRRAIDQLF